MDGNVGNTAHRMVYLFSFTSTKHLLLVLFQLHLNEVYPIFHFEFKNSFSEIKFYSLD